MSSSEELNPLKERVKQLEWSLEKLQARSEFENSKFLEPFPYADLEWKPQATGLNYKKEPFVMLVAYVSARAIQTRLDEAVGPGNWATTYEVVSQGVMCDLKINVGGEWVTKSDGSDFSEIESFKGGISGALKRAAVHWGIGRYLYEKDPVYADLSEERMEGGRWIDITDKKTKASLWKGYWKVPQEKIFKGNGAQQLDQGMKKSPGVIPSQEKNTGMVAMAIHTEKSLDPVVDSPSSFTPLLLKDRKSHAQVGDAKGKMIYGKMASLGWGKDAIVKFLKTHLKVDRTEQVPTEELGRLLDYLDRLKEQKMDPKKAQTDFPDIPF